VREVGSAGILPAFFFRNRQQSLNHGACFHGSLLTEENWSAQPKEKTPAGCRRRYLSDMSRTDESVISNTS
jgi:hypothetical protein